MSTRIRFWFQWFCFGLTIFLLLTTLSFLLLPLSRLADAANKLNNLNLQQARCERITKDVLILAYRSEGERAQALSELQDTFPLWQQEQNSLAIISDPQIQLLVLQSDADYTPMAKATQTLLSQLRTPPGLLQVTIILQHDHGYEVTMNQLVTLIDQDIVNNEQQFLLIESAFVGVGLILVILSRFWPFSWPSGTLSS